MGKLVLAKDWSCTPLGPIESWPQSLRTTVSLCLASNFPISIAWGAQHTQIYNDGYWPICGAKHPASLGQDFSVCWASAWPVIGASFERALRGETSFLEDQRMFLDRHGYLEETFFTFSFSPIRDESGGVGGLFHPVTETTAKMLSQRRMRLLRDVAGRTGKSFSVRAALRSRARFDGRGRAGPAVRAGLRDGVVADGDAAGQRRCRRRCGRRARCAGRARSGPGLAAGRGDPDARAGARDGLSAQIPRDVRRRVGGAVPRAPLGRDPAAHLGARRIGAAGDRDRRGQRASADERGLPQLLRPAGGRRDDRGRGRAGLRGRAEAGRDAGGARSRQDRLLQQRQPRVPDAADADARPDGRRAGVTVAGAGRRRPGGGSPQRPAPAEAGERAAGFLAHRGGQSAGAVRRHRSGRADGGPGQRLPLRRRAGGARRSRSTARRWARWPTSTATCGKRSSSTCCRTR